MTRKTSKQCGTEQNFSNTLITWYNWVTHKVQSPQPFVSLPLPQCSSRPQHVLSCGKNSWQPSIFTGVDSSTEIDQVAGLWEDWGAWGKSKLLTSKACSNPSSWIGSLLRLTTVWRRTFLLTTHVNIKGLIYWKEIYRTITQHQCIGRLA